MELGNWGGAGVVGSSINASGLFCMTGDITLGDKLGQLLQGFWDILFRLHGLWPWFSRTKMRLLGCVRRRWHWIASWLRY